MTETVQVKLDTMNLTDHETRPSTGLSTMPAEIIDKIVEKAKKIELLNLRKVSRTFRLFASRYNPEFSNILVLICEERTSVHFESDYYGKRDVKYEKTENGCKISYRDRNGMPKAKKIEGGDQQKIALNDLSISLRHQKRPLEKLNIYVNNYSSGKRRYNLFNTTIGFLESMSTLQVKVVSINGIFFHEIAPVIQNFKAGVLESITLDLHIYANDFTTIEQLNKLDQWKQAKFLKANWKCRFPIPIECLFHFTRFDVGFRCITAEDAIKVKDIITKSSNLEYGLFKASKDPLSIARVFNPNYDGDLYGSVFYTTADANYKINFGPYHLIIENIK